MKSAIAITLPKKRKFTYEDYLKTPHDQRYELIEGDLVMTPSPVPYHQWILKNIGFALESFVREKKMGKVFYAPCDVYLDKKNVLQPDILFISKERLNIIGEKNIQGAPDLIIEILSESTAYLDMVKKKKLYAQFSIKEYWIIDPGEKTAETYTLKVDTFILMKRFSEKDVLESTVLPGLKIKLSDVFAF
jgi:Uma2 family endonuclease